MRRRWEVPLAYAAGVACFTVTATILAAADSTPVAVLLGVAALAAVVATAVRLGAAYSVPAAMAVLLAYDWYQLPPTHSHTIPDATSLADLAVYVAVAVLIGQLAAYAARRATVTEAARSELAAEQAALRRVATLVARNVEPDEVFGAVAREAGHLLGVDTVHLGRYEGDGTVTGVGSWARAGGGLPVGTRASVEGDSVTARVLRTGRPARLDRYANATGQIAQLLHGSRLRSSAGAPIVVEGRLWGVIVASTRKERPLPDDTETRIAAFAELLGTAVANADARAALTASRARVVAAADDERRRVVRDLHDGAQQRLVHTVVTLKLARRALERGEYAEGLVVEALGQAERATAELRELAHGILPSVLTRGGLAAGVEALASRMPVPVDTGVTVERLPSVVEATAYFVVAEALTNVAKHASAGRATVVAHVDDGTLRVSIRDDGVGGARPHGSGLLGLADRVAVLDGWLCVASPADGGTLVSAAIPLDGAARERTGPRRRPAIR